MYVFLLYNTTPINEYRFRWHQLIKYLAYIKKYIRHEISLANHIFRSWTSDKVYYYSPRIKQIPKLGIIKQVLFIISGVLSAIEHLV